MIIRLIAFLGLTLLVVSCKTTKTNEADRPSSHQVEIHLKDKVTAKEVLEKNKDVLTGIKGFASRGENKWIYFTNKEVPMKKVLQKLMKSGDVKACFEVPLPAENSEVQQGTSYGKGKVNVTKEKKN